MNWLKRLFSAAPDTSKILDSNPGVSNAAATLIEHAWLNTPDDHQMTITVRECSINDVPLGDWLVTVARIKHRS